MDGFTHLATGGCPPIADLMLALAAEFRNVDADAADQRLDELALPLFGLAGGDLRVAAARLADVLDTDPGFDADPRERGRPVVRRRPGGARRPPVGAGRADGRGRTARRIAGARPLGPHGLVRGPRRR